MNIKNIINNKFKGNIKKKIMDCIIILLVGVLIIISADVFTSIQSSNEKNKKNTTIQVNTNMEESIKESNYDDKIKKELTDTLSLISGIGKVSVMIYYDGGTESVPGYNTNDTNRKIEEKDNQGGNRITNEITTNHNIVTVNDSSGSKPFVVKQLNPSIAGVIVIAEGAENTDNKEKLTVAVKTVLGIAQYRVEVFPMKKSN